jgi:antitoxin component HigA of HigAB toxin-antitoxin module
MDSPLPDRLQTRQEYEAAIRELDQLLDEDFEPGSEGDERVDRLAKLITDYEDQNSPMPDSEAPPT